MLSAFLIKLEGLCSCSGDYQIHASEH